MGVVVQFVSLFMPLDHWMVQVFSAAPILFRLRKLYTYLTTKIKWKPHVLVLAFSMAMIGYGLLSASYEIVHPDTLDYHDTIILFAAKYGLVPGVAQVNERAGLQSTWFLLQALFRFPVFHTSMPSFLNPAVLTWIIVYLLDPVQKSFAQKRFTVPAGIGVLLLCAGFLNPNLFFLSTISATNDVAVCLFLGIAFWLLWHYSWNWIAILFLLFAFTVKASAFPALLLLLVAPRKLWPGIAVLALLVFLPFTYRNYISSGYPLFPTAIGAFWNPDWKLPDSVRREVVKIVNDYATALWQHEELNYRTIIFWITALCMLPWPLLQWKTLWKRHNGLPIYILLTCLAGVIYCIVLGPTFRFAAAYLLSISVIGASCLAYSLPPRTTWLNYTKWTILALTILIGLYDLYRVKKYFRADMLVSPIGIVERIPFPPHQETAEPRGPSVKDGYRYKAVTQQHH